MNIDKYIAEMVKLRQAHGADVEVRRKAGIGKTTYKAELPRIANLRTDETRTLHTDQDPDRLKGVKVIIV